MEDLDIRRLDHMLVVGHALRRFGLRELIDQRCPVDPRSKVTTGECVEAMIATILMGSHTLYLVSDVLAPYDLDLIFGWGGQAEQFHDARVGKALDELFDSGVVSLYSAAVLRAVQVHELELDRLHLDTTSVKVFGRYDLSEEPEDPEDPQATPLVTRGNSKDHRPDLKQIVFGITVSADGAVPVFGRMASGGRSDSLEERFMLDQLAKVLPDPRDSLLVGDSKLFAGETLVLAAKHGFKVLTMMPRGVGLWDEVLADYDKALEAGKQPEVFKAVTASAAGDEDKAPEKLWTGASFQREYVWEDEEKVEHRIPLRLLVVDSSQLRVQKEPAVRASCASAREKLEKAVQRISTKDFNCERDAMDAAIDLVEKYGSPYHVVHHRVREVTRPAKRQARGRPPRDEQRVMETVYMVTVELEEDPAAVERELRRKSCFVLATTLLSEQEHPNAELFRAYQEQNSVEGSIRWAKHPLAVAPVFLKTDERIAALGVVYVLALMVYALIQRDVRRLLRDSGQTFPGNKGFTATPTTEVIFRLFEGINSYRVPGQQKVTVSNLTTAQIDALRLLRHQVLDDPRVSLATPRVPRPRSRGYRPPVEHDLPAEGNSDTP